MDSIKLSEQSRRSFLATSAAAGAASLLTEPAGAAADPGAIRPFHFNVADTELTDLRRRIKATKWPEKETVADDTQGVRLATMQKLARLLGDSLRLAQVRGQAEGHCRNSSPRSTDSTSTSFTFAPSTTTRCR